MAYLVFERLLAHQVQGSLAVTQFYDHRSCRMIMQILAHSRQVYDDGYLDCISDLPISLSAELRFAYNSRFDSKR